MFKDKADIFYPRQEVRYGEGLVKELACESKTQQKSII